METFEQADSGYPEEGPPGAVPDDAGDGGESAVRENARPDEEAENAPDNDEGKATGNRFRLPGETLVPRARLRRR